jgi:NAD(P)-dependent dehydrogenase (short-subunit alcohol dehydrogenase family)
MSPSLESKRPRPLVIVGVGGAVGSVLLHRAIQRGLSVVAVSTTLENLDAPTHPEAGGPHHLRVDTVSVAQWAERFVEQVRALVGDDFDLVWAQDHYRPGWLAELSVKDWDSSFRGSAREPWQAAKAVVACLRQNGSSLVILGSAAARDPLPGGGAYAIAHRSLAMLVQSLALELTDSSARVNIVVPPISLGVLARSHETSVVQSPASAEKVAEVIEFVLSDAGSAVQGQVIAADAAQTITSSLSALAATLPRLPVQKPQSSLRTPARMLVTGGGGFIAKAACIAIQRRRTREAEAGLKVLLIDRDPQRLEGALGELRGVGIDAFTFAGDMADPQLPENAVRDACRRFGGLDCVLSTAATPHGSPVSRITEMDWDDSFEVNVRSAWLLAKAAFEPLRTSGGSLVAVSSIAGLRAGLSAPVYSASKAGLLALIEQLALEWAPWQIRVNAVSPGSTWTPMNSLWQVDEAKRTEAVLRYPMGRLARAEEIGEAIAYLVSAEAAYVTAQNIVVDGGLSKSGY